MDRILVADLRRGRSWALELPDSIVVTGVDGLAFVSGSLVAHHPGAAGALTPAGLYLAVRCLRRTDSHRPHAG